MPHITIEYSSNVEARTDVQQLVQRIHQAVLSTGVASLAGLRTRAFSTSQFVVADGHPDNGYIAVFARLAAGRTADERARVLTAIVAAIDAQLGEAAEGLAISVEYIEIQPDFRLNDNRVRLHTVEGP